MERNRREFAVRVQQLLALRQWTQTDLAKKLAIQQSTISDWVNKGAFPTSEVMIQLCVDASVSADWLLLGRGSPRGPAAPSPTDQRQEGVALAISEMRTALADIERSFQPVTRAAARDALQQERDLARRRPKERRTRRA